MAIMEEAKEKEIAPEKAIRILKKAVRIGTYFVLGFLGLNLFLYILLSIPIVQRTVVNFATDQLKATLKTEASIGEVRLKLFSNVMLKDLYVEDLSQDTLIYAHYMEARLSPWKLISKGEVAVSGIDLEDFVININQQDSISDFNFQFIIDAFSSEDSTAVDTTSSSMDVDIRDIKIKRGRLKYDVFSVEETPGIFNPSHISLHDFTSNIDIKSIDFENLDIALNSLAVKDKSGLEVSSLSGRVRSKASLMWIDNLELRLPNSHLAMKEAAYNLDTDEFEIVTDEVIINPQDLKAVMPEMKFLRNNLTADIDAHGTLTEIDINRLHLYYGKQAVVEVHGTAKGIDNLALADIFFTIDEVRFSPDAIVDFARLGDSDFIVPEMIYTIDGLRMDGKVDGKLNNFNINAKAWIRQGAFTLNGHGSIDSTFEDIDVRANLRTQNFRLGELLGEDTGLGLLSTHANITARQRPKGSMNIGLSGALDLLEYNNESFKEIGFKGTYNPYLATFNIDSKTEELGHIYADVNLKQARIDELTLDIKLKDLKLDKLVKNEDWINPSLSFDLMADVKDFDIDNMLVQAQIDNLDFHGDNFKFAPGPISLIMTESEDKKKDIRLESSLFRVNVNGEMKFSTLYPEVSNILNKSLPSVFDEYAKIKDKERFQNFTYSIAINNTESYSSIFGIPADLMQPLRVSGSVNTPLEQIKLYGSIPEMSLSEDMWINRTRINFANKDSIITLDLNTAMETEISTYHFSYDMSGGNDKLMNKLRVNSDSAGLGMNGEIVAELAFSIDDHEHLITNVNFHPTDLLFGKMNLNLMPSRIEYEHDAFNIHDFAINLNKRDFFGMDGRISQEPSDSLKVYFAQAQLGDVLKGLGIDNIEAQANGEIYLKNIMEKPELYINDFMIYDIAVYTDTLGTLSFYSQMHEESKGFEFDATLQKNLSRIAEFSGSYPMEGKDLDINVFMDRFELDWLERFTAGLLTKVSGSLSSDIHIGGTTDDPQMKGFLGFNDTSLGIDYTNVIYNVSDTIEITPEYIGFKNLRLTDNEGNIARVNASITHKRFEDVKLAMDMNLRNFMILNTMHRTDSLFYGKIFASGRVNIKGDKNQFDINMQVQNGKNSRLNILIPQISEADEYKSVVYINTPKKDKTKDKKHKKKDDALDLPEHEPEIPVKISLALDVDEELNLAVVIDPLTGDQMEMTGSGSINFTYDMEKDIMRTFGHYALSDGKVKLNLQNIKRLDFAMRKGSELNFIGDPFQTKFNIAAFRRVRADLKTLDYSFEAESASTRVEVDCDLGITGNMNKMDLSYGISLPYANDDQKRRVSSLINTDEESIKQFAYLTVSGRFHSSTGSSGASFSDGMWTSLASSTISSGLNAALGNVLGDKWEVGTTLESTDGSVENLDMSVDISTKFFNDRLKLKTSLGYRTDNASNVDNSIIGDFEAEYQLNANWILRGYNQTNERFYDQAPTTQGVGVIYLKSAPNIKQLFMSNRRRRSDAQRRRAMREASGEINKEKVDSTQIDSTKLILDKSLENEPVAKEKKE